MHMHDTHPPSYSLIKLLDVMAEAANAGALGSPLPEIIL